MNALQQVTARDGKPILVVEEGDKETMEWGKHSLEVPRSVDALQGILTVIPMQLLSKVSQIECWSATRAPPGCLQYFYGKTRHTVESFGWDGTKTYSTGGSLAKMWYTTCFRPEKGMCGQYFAQTPVSSSLDAFELGNTDADELSDYAATCENGYVQIHSTWEEANDKFCGGYLGEDSGEATDSLAGAVHAMTSNAWSFQTNVEADMEAAYTGYSIDAQQTACTSSFGGE